MVPNKPNSSQGKEKIITRRDFVKAVGAVSLFGILASPVAGVLNREKIGTNSSPKGKENNQSADSAPVKPRAWCMVIDLRKCEGCVTIDSPPQCTQACIQGHFVPKGQKWIEVYEIEQADGSMQFMPTPCFQCENAPCVNVCPVGATFQNEDGVVLIDHRRCIGCRLCMGACPYHRRFFNWGTPELPPEAKFAEYSPIYPVPAVRGTVIKCMFCAHMLRDGKLPLCVAGCPMKALYIGDLKENVASNGLEVVQLSKFLAENDAFRYKEGLGTQPRVYYLPGHGQNFGHNPGGGKELKPSVWPWPGQGFDYQPAVWPSKGSNIK